MVIVSLMPYIYTACWSLLCIGAVAAITHERKTLALCRPEYRRFLLRPWKVTTFLIATFGFAVVAPYTGDPTWDYVDAVFMGVLTFLTAPWVVGSLYQAVHRQVSTRQVFVAVCLWMFSASWSYDVYIWVRYGYYPPTWLANIGASSCLYAAAGLLWNLERHPSRGVIFAFMQRDWPYSAERSGFASVCGFALPFMLFATIAILFFLL